MCPERIEGGPSGVRRKKNMKSDSALPTGHGTSLTGLEKRTDLYRNQAERTNNQVSAGEFTSSEHKEADDSHLLNEVRKTLSRHRDVDAGRVEIKIKNGEVTLQGRVDSEEDKVEMARLVTAVDGIVAVNIDSLKIDRSH